MDKLVGLGAAGVNIVNEFANFPQYQCYRIDSGIEGLKKDGYYDISPFSSTEEYEKNCPSVKNFLKNVKPEFGFVLAGSGKISGLSLALLEQVRDRKIHIMYIKGGERRMSKKAQVTERSTFGVLQEYARSGLFESFSVISNNTLKDILGKTPIIGYYDALNGLLVNTVHMVNVFENSKPIMADLSSISEVNRICTYGFSKFGEKDQENLFFPLDNIRQKRYYFAINKKQLEVDGDINNKIDEYLNQSEKEEIDTSYGIYPTNYKENFVYCKAYTNSIQEYK
jgi:hypothetical protein